MADLRLAVGVLLYLLAIWITAGLADLVDSEFDFFSPKGSLIFGLAFGLAVASLTSLFRRLEGHPMPSNLTRGLAAGPALASGALLGAFTCTAVVFVQWALGCVVVLGMQTGPGPWRVFLASLARNAGIGFAEELAFRGQVLGRVRERAGFGVAAILSSTMYAGCHFDVQGFSPAAFVGLSLLGLLLAGLLHRTGSLWVPIGFHMAWNTTQSGVFGLSMLDRHGFSKGLVALQQRGPAALVGAGFLAEGGLLTMAVLAAGAAFVLWPRRLPSGPARE